MIDNYFDQLRTSCERRKIPLISPETQSILLAILTEFQPKKCVEIGSAVGYSSLIIAKKIAAWEGQLTSFEVAYPAYLEAQSNSLQVNAHNITFYPFDITRSLPLAKLLPSRCDFVFIDAQKNSYGNYLELLQSLLGEENIILLDDVLKYQTKLDSLYRFLEKNQINYEIIPSEPGDGLMLIKNLKNSD